jgi:hypothetical protein
MRDQYHTSMNIWYGVVLALSVATPVLSAGAAVVVTIQQQARAIGAILAALGAAASTILTATQAERRYQVYLAGRNKFDALLLEADKSAVNWDALVDEAKAIVESETGALTGSRFTQLKSKRS